MPSGEPDEDEDLDPLEPHGLDSEEVPYTMLEACWARNCRHVMPSRRGAGPRPGRASRLLIAVADTLSRGRGTVDEVAVPDRTTIRTRLDRQDTSSRCTTRNYSKS
jgi:hypothetical protein